MVPVPGRVAFMDMSAAYLVVVSLLRVLVFMYILGLHGVLDQCGGCACGVLFANLLFRQVPHASYTILVWRLAEVTPFPRNGRMQTFKVPGQTVEPCCFVVQSKS